MEDAPSPRRYWWFLAGVGAIVGILAVFFMLFVPPKFTNTQPVETGRNCSGSGRECWVTYSISVHNSGFGYGYANCSLDLGDQEWGFPDGEAEAEGFRLEGGGTRTATAYVPEELAVANPTAECVRGSDGHR